MNSQQPSAIAGLGAGLVMSLAMVVGRRSGLLHKTLAEDAEDWLDWVGGSRRFVGQGGTTALEMPISLVAVSRFTIRLKSNYVIG